MRIHIAFVLVTLVFSAHVVTRRAAAAETDPVRLSPVWSLGVDNGRAAVLHNELNEHGLAFPLPAVRLYEVPPLTRPSAQEMGVAQGALVAVVPVSPDGQPLSEQLTYLPYNSVGRGQNGTEPMVVVGAKPPLANEVSSFDPLRAAGVPAGKFRAWMPFQEEGTGLLFTSDQTIAFSAGRQVLKIPHPGYEGCYAPAARIGATCVLYLEPGRTEPDPLGNPGSLVVFDLDGNVLHEVRFEPGRGLDNLYVSNDGTWVMATEQGEPNSIASDRVLWIDVLSGAREYVRGVAGGNRHHSDDSEYMAVVQGGWGKIDLFSMGIPSNPVPVSTFVVKELVVSASTNQDGSLVAAVLSSRRVLILDRGLRAVAVTGLDRESSAGVSFVGEFLFVGFQTDELPRVDLIMSSKHIDLFHVGSLR
jgi:hypothetical protein